MLLTLTDMNSVITSDNTTDVDVWREELRGYLHSMQKFHQETPDQIFMKLSAYTARASEIRSYAFDNDTRSMTAFRTKQVDPFIDECDRQFRLWSRVVSVQQTEIDLAGRVI